MALNAKQVLDNINKAMVELEQATELSSWDFDRDRMAQYGYEGKKVFRTRAVCNELSIFDWWNDTLSMSQLKQMKKFVETSIQLGFTGYVCFKVGAKGCANGMWASTDESLDGYSPKTGNTLYHSFVSGENYWDVELDGEWVSHKLTKDAYKLTLKNVKTELVYNKLKQHMK